MPRNFVSEAFLFENMTRVTVFYLNADYYLIIEEKLEEFLMGTFNVSQSVGAIVASLPGAAEVFEKYKIDFCCGGKRALSVAVNELNLNEEVVLNSLEEAYDIAQKTANRVDFREMSTGELIDYIENTHHVFVKRALPEISEYATAILRAHGLNHPNLFKVHKLFHSLKIELDQHLIKEEELLFPLLRVYEAGNDSDVLKKVKTVMSETEEEHEGAGDVLKELRVITDDYTVPDDGCPTFHKAYELMQELEADLFRHIHLENNILFLKTVG